mgnify:CR=1 FL=1
MVAALNLTGMRFGMLKVKERLDERLGKKVLWLCQCDCGKIAKCTTSNLTRGLSTSCGCVRTKHNGKGTRLYRIWTGMKDRCLNHNSKYRRRYGGRGITICDEWANDFSVFRQWAIENGYAGGLEIDRIDNDCDYCPKNCRWVTTRENVRNRSTSKLTPAKVMGIRFYLSKTSLSETEIGRRYGVSRSTISEIRNGDIWNDIR